MTQDNFSGLAGPDDHTACDHDGKDGPRWCAWDPATHIVVYSPKEREQVRRALLQTQILVDSTKEGSYSRRTTLEKLREISKKWDKVK